MNCPACSTPFEELSVAGIKVDVCLAGCAGLWFDHLELAKLDEPHEGAGESLLKLERHEGVRVDHTRRLRCPRCADSVLMRHFWSVKQAVEVDECGVCGGFWLDVGELRRIRAEFKSERERKNAAQRYFREVFGEELAQRKKGGEEKLAAAGKIAWMFRFLCPSYYLPGRQAWGADRYAPEDRRDAGEEPRSAGGARSARSGTKTSRPARSS